MTLCENNCIFIDYDYFTKHVNCECKVKNEINIIGDIIIDKDKLLNSFIDIKSMINIEVMKCYKYLFTRKGILYNVGSYILLSIISFYIISMIIFLVKGFSIIFSVNIINSFINIFTSGSSKRYIFF